MSGSRKQQNIWDAIGKLHIRDQLILLFVVIGIGVAMAVGAFMLILKTDMVRFHIPQSSLRDSVEAQRYRQATYTDLDILAQFPGTDYVAYVGGTEYLYNDYVASFKYNDEQTLMLGIYDTGVSISEFYSYALISAINKDFNAKDAQYTSMLNDTGYLNTFYLIYEGGVLKADRDYYIVSYIYPTEEGKNLLLMALTPVGKQSALNKSKVLVDKMLYAMGRSGGSDSESGDSANDSKASNSTPSDRYALDKSAEDNMTTSEKMDRIDREVAETQYTIEYPDAEDLEYYVTVDKTIEHAVFYIDYTEVKSVPDLAYLKAPGGAKYAPAYNNGEGLGMVYWEIDSPVVGNWLIHLSKNAKYGQFFAGVLSKEDFEEIYGNDKKPQPRDGQ